MWLPRALGLLLGLLGGAACELLHSLRYFDIGVSEPSPGVPEFVFVGYVDGNLIVHYSSEKGRTVPRADWMKENLDQQYWDRETQNGQNSQEMNRVDLDTLQDRYNQSRRAATLETFKIRLDEALSILME